MTNSEFRTGMSVRDTAIARHVLHLRFMRWHLSRGERDLAFMALEAAGWARAELTKKGGL